MARHGSTAVVFNDLFCKISFIIGYRDRILEITLSSLRGKLERFYEHINRSAFISFLHRMN
jgi:hypothetical protein